MIKLGLRSYGAGAIALGAVNLWFGALVATWQVVPDNFPAQPELAILTGLLLLFGGVALQGRRSAEAGALVLALVALFFIYGRGGQVAAAPSVLGMWLGLCEQIALVVGALCCWLLAREDGERRRRIADGLRIIFGLCCLIFAAAHLVYVKETAAMVPGWLPPGGNFWAYATGLGHGLAGLAPVSGIRALLAARLLTAMFVGFGLLVWLPILFATPSELFAWGGNAINLFLAGAAWALADTIHRFHAEAVTAESPAETVPEATASPA